MPLKDVIFCEFVTATRALAEGVFFHFWYHGLWYKVITHKDIAASHSTHPSTFDDSRETDWSDTVEISDSDANQAPKFPGSGFCLVRGGIGKLMG